MLSILIPIKDYDCHVLIEELHRQGEKLGMPFEILPGEDGTAEENLVFNSIADTLPNCRRLIVSRNIGRSNMRNLLATEAKYPYLIFIDCDAVVENPDFLLRYTEALRNCNVVCGGLYHAEEQPNNECSLRYRYEKAADRLRDAATRRKAPYDKFTTFNFAIKKDVFIPILFDVSITRYGYEDVLFGKELEKREILIRHIDNSLLHNSLESNAAFLAKTEQALTTLYAIKEKIGSTPLLEAYRKLERLHMTSLFMFYWRRRKESLKRNLLSNNPSLMKFSIYKLGYFISLGKSPKE